MLSLPRLAPTCSRSFVHLHPNSPSWTTSTSTRPMRIVSQSWSPRIRTFLTKHNKESFVNLTKRVDVNNSDKFKILFLGRDEFSVMVFKHLYQARDVWQSIEVATQPDAKTGRDGSVISVSPLKTACNTSYKAPVSMIPKQKEDFKTWTLPPPFNIPAGTEPPSNHLLITASFGRILTNEQLACFGPGRALNVHPSSLPRYRGPAPLQRAIMNGEKKTGVCVVEMTKKSEGIDSGAIWGHESWPISDETVFEELRDDLGMVGGQTLVSVLRKMHMGTAKSVPQQVMPNAPRAPLITAKDTFVNFHTDTADDCHRRYRALRHQRALHTVGPDGRGLQLNKFGVVVKRGLEKSNLSEIPGAMRWTNVNRMLLIRCAKGTVIGVTRVRPEGKPNRVADAYWNGLYDVKHGAPEVIIGLQ